MKIHLSPEEIVLILAAMNEVNFLDRRAEQNALFARLSASLERKDPALYQAALAAQAFNKPDSK